MAELPGDDVQCLLLGVRSAQDDFLEHPSFYQVFFIELSLTGDSNNIISVSG